jgi:ribosomal protein S12 methylthiotransferase accessory factor YcaO
MSYNFNVPVLMSLAVNKTTHAISVNLGSSPIFDIACERIITELYQGIKKLNEIKLGGQYPSIDGFDLRLKGTRWIGAEAICTIFPEFII